MTNRGRGLYINVQADNVTEVDIDFNDFVSDLTNLIGTLADDVDIGSSSRLLRLYVNTNPTPGTRRNLNLNTTNIIASEMHGDFHCPNLTSLRGPILLVGIDRDGQPATLPTHINKTTWALILAKENQENDYSDFEDDSDYSDIPCYDDDYNDNQTSNSDYDSDSSHSKY